MWRSSAPLFSRAVMWSEGSGRHNLNPFVALVDVYGRVLKRRRTKVVEGVRGWRHGDREGQRGSTHAGRGDQSAFFHLDHAFAVEGFAIVHLIAHYASGDLRHNKQRRSYLTGPDHGFERHIPHGNRHRRVQRVGEAKYGTPVRWREAHWGKEEFSSRKV